MRTLSLYSRTGSAALALAATGLLTACGGGGGSGGAAGAGIASASSVVVNAMALQVSATGTADAGAGLASTASTPAASATATAPSTATATPVVAATPIPAAASVEVLTPAVTAVPTVPTVPAVPAVSAVPVATAVTAAPAVPAVTAAPAVSVAAVVVAPAVTTAAATAPAPTAAAVVSAAYSRVVYVDAAAPQTGNGSAALPHKTLTAAMNDLRAGDDVVIAAGVYREWVVVPNLAAGGAATRIRAQAARTVTVKGSLEVGGWTNVAPGVYARDWDGDEPEQVFRAGASLQQIGGTVWGGYPFTPTGELIGAHTSEGGVWASRIDGGLNQLVTDSFTYDTGSRRIYVKLGSAIGVGEKLEVSARRHVLQGESVNGLTVEGIDFAHANTTFVYRQGSVKLVGKGNTLRNVVVHDMDGQCVQLIGEDNTLVDSTIERCGQVGITGNGKRLNILNNQVLNNNTRRFNKWWEAGGMKLIGWGNMQDAVVRGNVFAFNAGDGIWFDTDNTGNLIENNVTAYNEGFGIHYEASQTGTIRGNRSYGNTMRGIYLFESSTTLIEGNVIFGNAMEGIAVVAGSRSATDPHFLPVDNRVLGNTIAWNDYARNWIQLVLPGTGLGAVSDRNAFKAEGLSPRMSMAFMSPTNYPCETLACWQTAQRVDASSTTQTAPMPDAIKAALAAKRLIGSAELPSTLLNAGSY